MAEYILSDPKTEEGIRLKHSDMVVDPKKLEYVLNQTL